MKIILNLRNDDKHELLMLVDFVIKIVVPILLTSIF